MARTHKKELANSSTFANIVFGIMAGLCPITSTWYPSYSALSSDTKSTVASSISHIQVPVWEQFLSQEIMQELLFAEGVLEQRSKLFRSDQGKAEPLDMVMAMTEALSRNRQSHRLPEPPAHTSQHRPRLPQRSQKSAICFRFRWAGSKSSPPFPP